MRHCGNSVRTAPPCRSPPSAGTAEWPPLRWNPTAKARPGSSATVCLPLCRMRSASAWGTPTTPPPSKTAPPRRRPPAAWPARRRPAAGSTCTAAREPSCMRSSGRNTLATRTAPSPAIPCARPCRVCWTPLPTRTLTRRRGSIPTAAAARPGRPRCTPGGW